EITESTQPPRYPASSPSDVPTVMPINTTVNPTSRDVREAYNTRSNTSRPNWSVPIGCARLGGCRVLGKSWATTLSYGATTKDASAVSTNPITTINPSIA